MDDSSNPYQSPKETDETFDTPTSDEGQKRLFPFESAAGRAKVVVICLAIGMGIDVVSLFSTSLELDLLHDFESGAYDGLPEDEINEIAAANDIRQMGVGGLQFLVIVLTSIAFLMWFHRSHRNLGALGNMRLKYTPAGAVWGFFIPILNLFYPCRIAIEIWKGSHPDGLNRTIRTSPIVGLWWALWIVDSVFGYIAFRMSMKAEALSELVALSEVFIACDLANLFAAIPAIFMIRAITKNQDVRFDLLNASATLDEQEATGDTFAIE